MGCVGILWEAAPVITMPKHRKAMGFTLIEALMVLSLLGLVMGLGLQWSQEQWARLQVEMAARRLMVGLDRGRDAAERSGEPCALGLDGTNGWVGQATRAARACVGADTPLHEGLWPPRLRLAHTFAGPVEFTANGLAIDGGTVVVGSEGTELVRCLVMSPPLGITRLGLYQGMVAGRPDDNACKPDPLL